MENVIQLPPRMVTGKMTLVAPACDCLPVNGGVSFEQRLYMAMTLLFHAWDLKIDTTKFTNEDGQVMTMFNIDVTDWSAPDHNELDDMAELG